MTDYEAMIERIYEHVDNDRVEKAVMACLRLARNVQDYLNVAIFLRELYGDKKQFKDLLVEDTRHLKTETVKYVFDRSFDSWLACRTLPFGLGVDRHDVDLYHDPDEDDPKQRNVLVVGVGELEKEIPQLEQAIADLAVPLGMAPFDTAAFTDSYIRRKTGLRLRINAMQTVRSRIKARCFNYAVSVERQWRAQQKPVAFLQKVQTEVNNYFKARSEDVHTKLEKAAQLVDSSNPEDYSALLTQVRRAIKAVADHFYPPVAEPVVSADGKERKLGDEQYLNRLEEFLRRSFPVGSTSSELLNAELSLLAAFARKLNDIASKGVHANVSDEEAKQGLLGLYMFLYNVISKLERKNTTEAASPAQAANS